LQLPRLLPLHLPALQQGRLIAGNEKERLLLEMISDFQTSIKIPFEQNRGDRFKVDWYC
jgi:hypothetical protein